MKIEMLVSRYSSYIIAIIFISLLSIYVYNTYNLATNINTQEYVSDEVWYVNSARNILRTVFGVQPIYVDTQGYSYYTIIFNTTSSVENNELAVQKIVNSLHGNITKIYTQFPGIGIKIPKNANVNIFSSLPGIIFIQSGYPYPDVSNIENYMNYEHPPLFKYMIGASMMVFGDKPLSWRIPSLVMGIGSIILVFFIVLQLVKIMSNPIVEVLAVIIALVAPLFDAIMVNMTSVAMLDIGLAFFSILSLYFALNNRYVLSAIMIGLATSIKLSGIFLVPALYIAMRLNGRSIRDSLLFSIYIPISLWFIMNLPLISYIGIKSWLDLSVTGAISWHLSSRPPNGPPSSPPWGWLINQNPFYLHYNPTMGATLNIGVYLLTVALIFLSPFLASKISKNLIIPVFWFIFPFLGYTTVYILGNHTLYSFYAVMMSPVTYVLLGTLVVTLIESTYTLSILDILKWHKNAIIKLLRNEVQLPAEFKIHKILLPNDEEAHIVLFALIITTFSFIIHLPSNINLTQSNFYSDIAAIPQNLPGIDKIPYINYSANQTLLVSLIIYITYLIASMDINPVFSFYLINSFIIYIAVYYLFKDLYWITKKLNLQWWRLFLFAGSLTFILYSIYSWELIAVACSFRALRYFMEEKHMLSAILFGLTFNVSIFSIIPVLAIITNLNKKLIIKYLTIIMLIIISFNLPFMIINMNLWLTSIINIAWNNAVGTWLIEIFGDPSSIMIKYASITLITISLLLLFKQHTNEYQSLNHKIFDLSWKSIAIVLSLSYIYTPQTTLQLLPYMTLTPNMEPLLIILTDLFNALVIITWFNYKEWSQAFFKITPTSPLDGTAMPTILSTLRNITILIALILTLKTYHKFTNTKKQYDHS
jgi:predicted membrane-bound dolichyl-phosphate-mannose-protein mannosyltransferase